MSKNAKNLVPEGVFVPSHMVHKKKKKEIGISCKKKKSKPFTVVGTI